MPIVGDLRLTLQKLLPLIEERDRTPWLDQMNGWRRDHPSLKIPDSPDSVLPQEVVRAIYDISGGEARVIADVGQNQMWAAQHYWYERPRMFFSAGGLGPMGYALPASHGRKAGDDSQDVWCVTGDGGLLINIQEFNTLAAEGINVKVAVLNNGHLGMIRQWQEFFYEGRYMGSFLDNPDFAKVGQRSGCAAWAPARATKCTTRLPWPTSTTARWCWTCTWTGWRTSTDDRAGYRREQRDRGPAMNEPQTHMLVATVADHPGVLTRVASLFRRRGFNIASLAVGHSEEAGYSRMTIAVEGSTDEVKQCEKQLYKLVEVVSVRNLTGAPAVMRELAMIKVRVNASERPGLAEVTDIFRGEIVDVSKTSMIVQMTGGQSKIDRFLDVITEYPIEEISRTGVIAIARDSVSPRNGRTRG